MKVSREERSKELVQAFSDYMHSSKDILEDAEYALRGLLYLNFQKLPEQVHENVQQMLNALYRARGVLDTLHEQIWEFREFLNAEKGEKENTPWK